jgi:hypothetical protein
VILVRPTLCLVLLSLELAASVLPCCCSPDPFCMVPRPVEEVFTAVPGEGAAS